MNTALKNVEEPVGDFWLQLAETVREAWASDRRRDGLVGEEAAAWVH